MKRLVLEEDLVPGRDYRYKTGEKYKFIKITTENITYLTFHIPIGSLEVYSYEDKRITYLRPRRGDIWYMIDFKFGK